MQNESTTLTCHVMTRNGDATKDVEHTDANEGLTLITRRKSKKQEKSQPHLIHRKTRQVTNQRSIGLNKVDVNAISVSTSEDSEEEENDEQKNECFRVSGKEHVFDLWVCLIVYCDFKNVSLVTHLYIKLSLPKYGI